MTDLKIPVLKNTDQAKAEEIALQLTETGLRIPVDKINWPEHPFRPTTAVYAGYSKSHLWLRFMVEGDYIRAEGKNDQDPVYQDSCVEFFVQVGERYRNFEFNCLGICLSAIGSDRYSRERLDPERLSTIIRASSFDVKNLPEEGNLVDWSLTVGIPMDLIQLKPGDKFRCNFYKCGDHTKIPHYVTWAPIAIPAPDFHRPEYFGELQLAEAE